MEVPFCCSPDDCPPVILEDSRGEKHFVVCLHRFLSPWVAHPVKSFTAAAPVVIHWYRMALFLQAQRAVTEHLSITKHFYSVIYQHLCPSLCKITSVNSAITRLLPSSLADWHVLARSLVLSQRCCIVSPKQQGLSCVSRMSGSFLPALGDAR